MKFIFNTLVLILSINLAAANGSVEVVKGTGKSAVVITKKVKDSDVAKSFEKIITDITKDLARLKIAQGGPAFFKLLEMKNGMTTFQAGFPTEKKLKKLTGFDVITLPKSFVVQVEYTGSFADTGPAYTKIAKFLEKNKQEVINTPYEFYISNPATVQPPNQKVLVLFPLK